MKMKPKPVIIRLAREPDFVLDVSDEDGISQGSNICLNYFTGSISQQWTWDGNFLRPISDADLVVNPARVNFRRPRGTNVQLWSKTKSIFQKWDFSEGIFRLKANML